MSTMPRESKRNSRRRRRRETSSSSSTSSAATSTSSSSSEDRHRRLKRARRSRKSPTVRHNVITSSVIPEFDPLVDDIYMWTNVVEANARTFGWSDKEIKYQALQKLKNTAKLWYDSLQKNRTSWTSWKWKDWRIILIETFETKRNMYCMLKELMEVKPKDGQSLYEFYFQQKSKIDRLRLAFSERDIISIIVGSIGDEHISTAADAGSFRGCDDLASFLHNKIHTPNELKVVSKSSSNTKQQFSRFKSDNTSKPDVSNNVSSTFKITCFTCGEPGHKRADCKHKDVKCSNCNKIGHLETICRLKNRLKIEKSAEVKLINANDDKQKFFKEITVNNCKCQAFIDMGSDCSLITSNLANALGLVQYSLENPVTLTGFTNESHTTVDMAVTEKLKVDNVELLITFYIIKSLSNCNLLIGRNFTENKDIMYTRIGSSLVFQPVNYKQVLVVESLKFNVNSKDHEAILNNIFCKYPNSISDDLSSLGKTTCVELDIELTTCKPVSRRPYRMSESEKKITREIIDDLLKNCIIRESNSPYASP
ncbi:uncharacterized protein LOC128680304, partial [Plodia interpunctella]|uniref:uncharacterized protein LOC128680304 n=1 Tax=Plodia interpunctella TaxID=58824 RepID=UPI003100E84C